MIDETRDGKGDDPIAPELSRLIETACDRFEEAWKTGDTPRIEDYLDEFPESVRAELVRHLRALDLTRRSGSVEPSAGEGSPELTTEAGSSIGSGEADPVPATEPDAPIPGPCADEPTVPFSPAQAASPKSLSPSSIDPDAPLIEDDFQLLSQLGAGGMGEVFECVQKSLRKRVALKVIKREALDSPARVRRFVAEARTLARLKHPHIVGVHGLGRMFDGRYFLVMDLLEGGTTLHSLIKGGPMEVERAAKLTAMVAEAIEHAHSRGVIHRDLKPSNVLLDGSGEPHVTDFGLAKIFDTIDPDHPQTTADQILGTPHYMSPEQADRARGPVTPRTDVFGLGGILFALLTGRPPLEGDSITQLLAQLISSDPVRSPRALRPEVPPALEEVCRKCLQKDVAQRYASAREVAGALHAWLEHRDVVDGEQREKASEKGIRTGVDRREWVPDHSLKGIRHRRNEDGWELRAKPTSKSRVSRLLKIASALTLLVAVFALGPFYVVSRFQATPRPPTAPMAPMDGAAVATPPPLARAGGPEPSLPETPSRSDLLTASAQVAVRASKEILARFGAGTGSVVIVLDCSGSMLDQTGGGRTKFEEAQEALGEVLRLVPSKTELSLWTFSQLPPGVNQIFRGDPLVNEPELTIKPLLPMAPWDPRRTDALIGQIGKLRPFLETPLVTAMWMAANQDLKSAKGLKTLLVLTDGDDNQLEKFKPKYNPNKLSVNDFIVSVFKPLDITVNMVYFTPAGNQKEIDSARDRFGPALAQLKPRGSFRVAKDLGELIATLQRGLIQKLTCQILNPDGTPAFDEPLDVTPPNEEERWSQGLKPRVYKLRVNMGSYLDQDFDLRPAEKVVAELVETEEGVKWAMRPILADERPQAAEIETPAEIEQGTASILVRAHVKPPASGIKEAAFACVAEADFPKAEAEGRIVLGQFQGGDGSAWEATIPIPRDVSGKLVITVRFKSGVGLTAFASGTVLIRERPVR